MITLFSWGYWGWGNATEQLVESADLAEKNGYAGLSSDFAIRTTFGVRYANARAP